MRSHGSMLLLTGLLWVCSCQDDRGGVKPDPDGVPPNAVQDLAAEEVADGLVLLTWTAPGDDGTEGTASSYDVRCTTLELSEATWSSATILTTTRVPHAAGEAESLRVPGRAEGEWSFGLKAADERPNWSALSNVAHSVLGDHTPPGVVTDLVVSSSTARTALLTWTAPGDDGTRGTATAYDLRYSTGLISEENWEPATRIVDVPAPGPPGTPQEFVVENLDPARHYSFALKTSDEVPNRSRLSNVADVIAGLRRLTTSPTSSVVGAVDPCWSPAGDGIAFSADWRGNLDVYVTSLSGVPARLTSHPEPDSSPIWSPDGTRVAFLSHWTGQMELWVMDAQPGAQPSQLTAEPWGVLGCTWSPDGSSIAYAAAVAVSPADTTGLFILPSAGGPSSELFRHAWVTAWPAWSPDGTRIAFISDRGGARDIWGVPPNPADPELLLSMPGAEGAPSWSPDGTRLAYQSDKSGNQEIWIVSGSGSDDHQITFDPDFDVHPTWSPDGARIAFASRRDGRFDIYIQQIE